MAGSGKAHLRPAGEALLRVEDLVQEFPVGRTGLKVHAVSGISLDVLPGETLGIVGESGCGKSTTGKAILHITKPTSGSVVYDGQDLVKLSGKSLRGVRRKLQMIFQDPISSLNPSRKVGDIVGEPLEIWKVGDKASRTKIVDEMLDAVGLDPEVARPKRPKQFSGGQCQRISIARSLVLDPDMIICDEPVSALDVSVQAQIMNLLEDLKKKFNLTLIFIAHDLAVVKNISDRVAVMYLGKMCEVGGSEALYAAPAHPYTHVLIDSIPIPDPNIAQDVGDRLSGELPSPMSPPSGCRFRTRCPRAEDICISDEPKLRPVLGSPDHFVACHFPLAEAGAVPVEIS